MKHLLLLLLAGLTYVTASEGAVETDIIPRTVNFLIFAGLVWYLLADKLKNFFRERQEGIASELDKVDEKIKASKKAKEDALAKIEDAKRTAAEIQETTQKEIAMMVKKIDDSSVYELEQLERQKEEIKRVSENKMVRGVVTDSLNEVLDINDIAQNKEELINSLIKKVA